MRGPGPFEGGGDIGDLHGLAQVIVHAGREAEFAITLHGVGGERDDPGPLMPVGKRLNDAPGGFEAVHLGHLHIHENHDRPYQNNITGWGPEIIKRRPDITMDTVERFLTKMYHTNPDFVYTVTRDFVRSCQTPVLILPDDSPPHPYVVAMECAMLAPKSEVSMFPWKKPKERIPLAVRQIRSFLRAHRPA